MILQLCKLFHFRWNFAPTEKEQEFIKQRLGDDLRIPEDFVRTAQLYDRNHRGFICPPRAVINPQTVTLCEKLGIRDPLCGLADDYSNYDSYPSSPKGFSTPEKYNLNDSTYVSFNNSNTSENNTSMHSNQSSMCNSFVASSPCIEITPKRLKLSLPAPVNDSINDDVHQSDVLPFEIDRQGK